MPMPSPLLLLLAAMASGSAADPHPAALVGEYDGGQMEMAARLVLKADGRFEYGLSYGALDEQAAGTWHAEGSRVILDSDPVTPPRFTLLGQKIAPTDTVVISLETPRGMDQQYFHGVALYADGTATERQMPVEGDLSLPVSGGKPPAIVRVGLPIFDLASDPVTVDPAKGLAFAFRFEPNDLGHVDFRGAALEADGGQLALNRYDRQIRFRRTSH